MAANLTEAGTSQELLHVDEERVPQMLREPQRPRIGPPPRSALLNQLAGFLPEMAASNARMEQNEPVLVAEAEFASEAESAAPGDVEMDLYCGLMAAPAADETAVGPQMRVPGGSPQPGSRKRAGAGIVEL
jgi:hypothetical protein